MVMDTAVPPSQDCLDSLYPHPLISERAIDEARSLKVTYIGAGISGILAAIQFPRYVPNLELTIYEKNPTLGGTWYENRYPGCACDIPAHCYQLSFESSTDWKEFYADSADILRYWERVADKYNVRKHMRFSHKCVEARWMADTSRWRVKILQLDTGEIIEDECDVFMTGVGILNQWDWPKIPGLHSFKGPLLHSADWDTSFNAEGKDVAVIGAGSSGIQIVPSVLPQVKHMDHYVRSSTWIATPFADDEVQRRTKGMFGNFKYTEDEKEAWRKDPPSYLKYRKNLEFQMLNSFAATHLGTPAQELARETYQKDMQRRLKVRPDLFDLLLPTFPPSCKRITPGPGYLEALVSPKVDVIQTPISHVIATGIITADGKHHPVDAIVCATGFDTNPGGHIPIYGRDGTDLRDRYSAHPETYLSICTYQFPNFFQSIGPHGWVGGGSLLLVMEQVHLYVAQVLQQMSHENIETVEVKREEVQNFSEYCTAFFRRTVFDAECPSWYKTSPPNGTKSQKLRGRVTALWPGSTSHALKALQSPRWQDFEIRYADRNPFSWFGNGWTTAQLAEDQEELTRHLGEVRFLHDDLDPVVGSKNAPNGHTPDCLLHRGGDSKHSSASE